MSKHIHIHLPKGMTLRAPAKDAGEFKESDHPRDKGGKFSTSGAAGGTAEHHAAQEKAHLKARMTATDPWVHNKHAEAQAAHSEAARKLGEANTPAVGGNAPANKEHQAGLLKQAQEHADRAARHEAELRQAGKPDPNDSLNAWHANKVKEEAKQALATGGMIGMLQPKAKPAKPAAAPPFGTLTKHDGGKVEYFMDQKTGRVEVGARRFSSMQAAKEFYSKPDKPAHPSSQGLIFNRK